LPAAGCRLQAAAHMIGVAHPASFYCATLGSKTGFE
jgi:putative hemolysin